MLRNFYALIIFILISVQLSAKSLTKIAPGMRAELFKQRIDHSGELAGQVFDQRYWIDSEFAENNSSPILLRMGGEGNINHFLPDQNIEFAKKLKAHVIYIEHRYYGWSQPFKDLATDNLKYLTLDNVMKDLVYFQQSISQSERLSGEWIIVGGSYSGTVAALYRYLYPEQVAGALASSAPMRAYSDQRAKRLSYWDTSESTSIEDNLDMGSRQWTYQACTDVGFWMAKPWQFIQPDKTLCKRLFGASGVNNTHYNSLYYLPLISAKVLNVSNILFTYGSRDIWTKIGVSSEQNKNPNISIFMIDRGGHHSDLNIGEESEAISQARALFVKKVKLWVTSN